MRGFHISMRSVGEPSGLDFTVAREPVPRDGSKTVFIVARGPVPRDLQRHVMFFRAFRT